MSLSLGQSVNPALLGGAAWWPETSTLAADFPKNRYRVRNSNVNGVDFLDVTRASTGFAQTLSDSLTSFTVNEPRRTDKGLLIEPSATNLITYSQEYTHSAWSKFNVTIVETDVLAPDGTPTASKITFDSPDNSRLRMFNVASGGMSVTGSVYLKGSGTLRLSFYGNDGSTYVDAEIVLTPEWVRYETTCVFGANATDRRINIWIPNATYTATECYVWGVQIEEDRLTSYIKTESATVTRPSDIVQANDIATTLATMSRAMIVVEFDVTEDLAGNYSGQAYFSISNSANTEWMEIQHIGNGKIRVLVKSGGVVTSFYLGGIRLPGHHKIAFGINADGSYSASINGETALSSTSTLTDLSVLTETYLGATISGLVHAGSLHQLFLVLDEDVSAARLEELSTL